MRNRFYWPGLLILWLVLGLPGASATASASPPITLNSKPIAAQTYVEEGNLYLPVRAIGEALGYGVSWSQKAQTVTITSARKIIVLNISAGTIASAGHEYYMMDRFIVIADRLFLRDDFFADSLALQVDWSRSPAIVRLNSIQENAISIQTVKEASEDPGTAESSALKITVQYPQIDGLQDKVIQANINTLFRQAAENAVNTGRKNAAELAEYARKYGNPNKCETYFDYRIKYNRNHILSLIILDYQYAGGAHGSTVQTAYTINLITGAHYALPDLFKPHTDYVSALSKTVKAQLDERNLTAALFSPFDRIGENQYYYLSNRGLVVYFQQYDILPYAAGIQEFAADFSVLGDLPQEPSLFEAGGNEI